MRVTGIRCEQCSKLSVYPMEVFKPPYEWSIPVEWFSLYQGSLQGSDAWHFCSRQCLRQWLMEVPVKDEEEGAQA